VALAGGVFDQDDLADADMAGLAPSLAVIEIPPARLITYCRRGARCQLFS
jgi:hypothetical protein